MDRKGPEDGYIVERLEIETQKPPLPSFYEADCLNSSIQNSGSAYSLELSSI